jgi:hypothetical protein
VNFAEVVPQARPVADLGRAELVGMGRCQPGNGAQVLF